MAPAEEIQTNPRRAIMADETSGRSDGGQTLQVVPTRWFRWEFAISQGSQPIAGIDISSWRERGELTVQGTTFRVSREGR